jgi:hypothetical protein
MPSKLVFSVVLLAALGVAVWALAPSAILWAQVTFHPTEAEQDAKIFFGPERSAYLTLAERIARGDALKPSDLNAVANDIDRRFQIGQFRLLEFAWRVGNIRAFDALLARGADPRAPLRTTDDPPRQDLVYLVLTSDAPKAAPAVQSLLRHGLGPNEPLESGYTQGGKLYQTPLYGPVSMKNLTTAKVLLDAGADPWQPTSFEHAPIVQIALDSFNFDFLNELADRGAFKGQTASRIKPLIDTMMQYLHPGDETARQTQALLKRIVDQSGYPRNDRDVAFILSGEPRP